MDHPFIEPSCNETPRESDPQAAVDAPGASERMERGRGDERGPHAPKR